MDKHEIPEAEVFIPGTHENIPVLKVSLIKLSPGTSGAICSWWSTLLGMGRFSASDPSSLKQAATKLKRLRSILIHQNISLPYLISALPHSTDGTNPINR